jgi:ATP-dependent protease ClpP protease subunit
VAKPPSQNNPSRYDQILGEIQEGVQSAQYDFRKRKKLMEKLEKEGDPQPRRVAMYYSRLDRSLTHSDVLPFTGMLKEIGKVENLDLIIHSPGGDGMAADKLLDLCRKYCSKTLRVVVPLYAKSAATLIALGGDKIIMGESSEIGPIDAQVFIVQDGSPQQVSADHFLRAEEYATSKLASDRAEEVEAGRIQLASMSPAFLKLCRDLQDFGRQFARSQLQAHMFAAEYAAEKDMWEARINAIVDNLSASGTHLSHGKMITAAAISADPTLKYLKIDTLPDNDPYWLAVDDLLQRTDVVAKTQDVGKILMTRDYQLLGA